MPAPFRWVIDLPGSPGVYAIDSTDIGDWIQPADQGGVRIYTVPFDEDMVPIDSMSVNMSEEVPDPPTPPDLYPNDFFVMATSLHGGFAGLPLGGAASFMRHKTWHILSGTLDGDDDPFYYSHINEGTRRGQGRPIGAHLVDTFWREDWLPAPPAGAIGYEVEQVEVAAGSWGSWGPWADPVRLDLQVSIAPTVRFGTHLGGIVIRVQINDIDGTNTIRFEPTGLESSGSPTNFMPDSAGPSVVNYAELVHLVHDRGPTEEPSLYDVVIEDFTIPYTGLVGAWWAPVKFDESTDVQVLVDGAPDDAIEIIAGVNFTGTYTIRPPRIRWIYARTPFRRTYPRDDALAGGAQRTWPPSKAYQSLRRTSGGIF